MSSLYTIIFFREIIDGWAKSPQEFEIILYPLVLTGWHVAGNVACSLVLACLNKRVYEEHSMDWSMLL